MRDQIGTNIPAPRRASRIDRMSLGVSFLALLLAIATAILGQLNANSDSKDRKALDEIQRSGLNRDYARDVAGVELTQGDRGDGGGFYRLDPNDQDPRRTMAEHLTRDFRVSKSSPFSIRYVVIHARYNLKRDGEPTITEEAVWRVGKVLQCNTVDLSSRLRRLLTYAMSKLPQLRNGDPIVTEDGPLSVGRIGFVAEVQFMDAYGVVWRRAFDGKLSPLVGDDGNQAQFEGTIDPRPVLNRRAMKDC